MERLAERSPDTMPDEATAVWNGIAQRPPDRSLRSLESLAAAGLGVVVLVAAWGFQAAPELSAFATGLAIAGMILVIGGLTGIAGRSFGPITGARRVALLTAAGLMACMAAAVIVWAGSVRASTDDQGWTDFLNQLLATSTEPTGAASASVSAAAPVATPTAPATSQATPQAVPTEQQPSGSALARPSQRSSAAAPSPRGVSALMPSLERAVLSGAAQALHEGVPALQSQLRSGLSLRQEAAVRHVPFGEVQRAVETALAPVLNQAVQNGTLSRPQEAAMLKAVSSAKFGEQPGLPRP